MLLATWYHPFLAVLFSFLAILLMAVILLQRGKGVGLAGAFGGAGGHTAFGAKTGDVLTWATIVIAVALLAFVILLNFVFRPLQAPGAAPPPAATPVSTPISTPTPTPAEPAAMPEPAAAEQPAPTGESTADEQPAAPDKPAGENTPDEGGGDPPNSAIFGENN
jgi:preprotein translocase subunit SecG